MTFIKFNTNLKRAECDENSYPALFSSKLLNLGNNFCIVIVEINAYNISIFQRDRMLYFFRMFLLFKKKQIQNEGIFYAGKEFAGTVCSIEK
jgi:hypothetical protein